MKDTKIIVVNSEDDLQLNIAAKIIKDGGTVAFPTETVYGLGGNVYNKSAINNIFVAKGRPSDNPLIVHISSKDDLNDLVVDISKKAKLLIKAFWPGAITLIFKKSSLVSKNVTAGLETVAIRLPENKIANKLIKLSGVPVAAPSANISGKPSPTEGKHVVEDLNGKVDCIIISNKSKVGLESTIIDTTVEPPMLLRPGGITVEDIEAVIGKINIDPFLEKKIEKDIKPKAPGMKYTHYSPEAEVIVIMGDSNSKIIKINELIKLYDKKIGVMCSDETQSNYKGVITLSLGSKKNMAEIASNLFKVLREFDDLGVDIVLAEGYDTLGMGKAIMNRLNKAAGFNIINV